MNDIALKAAWFDLVSSLLSNNVGLAAAVSATRDMLAQREAEIAQLKEQFKIPTASPPASPA